MFTEELNVITQTEDKADALRKEAKAEARMLIERANTEAGRIISEAEEKAKDRFENLISEGQKAAQIQYDEAIACAEDFCVKMAEEAGKKQDQVVKFISERIVKASVNN